MMRGMAKPASNLRLFVALYPPMDLVRSLSAALEGLALPSHRPTPPGQIHMTLQFIGDTPAKAMESTLESVAASMAKCVSFSLQVLRLIDLPRRGPSRLVAAETDRPGPLRELQSRLVTRLARAPRGRPGDRFVPHLTLCRFRSPTVIDPIDQELTELSFEVTRLSLMRSTLHPDGARHHEVASFSLDG